MMYVFQKKNSNLKNRELVFSVDLVTRGMFPNALLSVSFHHAGSLGGIKLDIP